MLKNTQNNCLSGGLSGHGRAPARGALAVGSLLLALAAGGCLEQNDYQRPLASQRGEAVCYDCHGDPANGDPAPPPAFWREPDRVDAHRAHLDLGVPCETCHVVPQSVFDPGHIDTDLPAELTWTGLAVADGADPSYDVDAGTCAGTYCHGGTLDDGGGSNTTPNWFIVDGTQADCGTCHGLPPAEPHPPGDNCSFCHGEVIGADGEFVAPELHIDGVVEVIELDCQSCHGSGDVPAPPVDLEGNTATTAPGVGAHRAHLGAAAWHPELTCNECHVVPENISDPGHLDSDPPAELTWGELATANDAAPVYDFETNQCDNTYCHGATLADGDGSNTSPVWTVVDGTQAACGTCHGLPPGGLHPPRVDCAECHSMVVSSSGFVAPELHIDGIVEVDELECDACHGENGDPAPPVTVDGGRSTTLPGVGAHQAHLATDSIWHADFECDECHQVPATVDAPGHNDTALPAELTWGDIATAEDAEPAFDEETFVCSNTYCHGGAFDEGGGSNTEPVWTVVNGTQAVCGSCHGLPPGSPHPDRTDCESCHGLVMEGPFDFRARELHIDGTVELNP